MLLSRLQSLLKYCDGTDHEDVGKTVSCHIKNALLDVVTNVTLLAIRKRFMTVGLYLTTDEKIVGVAYQAHNGYESRSFINVDENTNFELTLAQLGFSLDGD